MPTSFGIHDGYIRSIGMVWGVWIESNETLAVPVTMYEGENTSEGVHVAERGLAGDI